MKRCYCGHSGLQKPYVRCKKPSADLLYGWAEERDFVWLLARKLLDGYKEVLKRLGVCPNLTGTDFCFHTQAARDV
jgi:hypothetical protein